MIDRKILLLIPKGKFKVTVALKTSHTAYTYSINRIIKKNIALHEYYGQ